MDVLLGLCTSQDYLSADEDEKNDLWLGKSVDKTGENFRFVPGEALVFGLETFERDGEGDLS